MIEIKINSSSRALFIDGLCQGVMDKDGTPASPYMKPVVERIAGLLKGSEILFLGGGLYVLPKWAQDRGHSVSVVEIDPMVQAAARPQSDSFYMGIGDAKTALDTMENEWFDFIFLDIWPNDPAVYCADYFVKCKQHLKKGKTLAFNFIADNQVDLDAMGKLAAAVFSNVKMNTIYLDKEMKKPCQAVYFCD